MGSRKPSANARRVRQFKAELGGMDDLFAREEEHIRRAEAEHDEALERKACTSKNRYATRAEAEDAIRACAQHGAPKLRCYRCRYCNGWHLTSKPQ